jgi:dTDP-4-amino-4,6-dideoxygalactose transaminase
MAKPGDPVSAIDDQLDRDRETVARVLARERRRDPRRAYRVVDDFEDELAYFCGAPYAVAVDSCTNAIHLALVYDRETIPGRMAAFASPDGSPWVTLPKRTYVGVLQAARNAGYQVDWSDEEWQHYYAMPATPVIDSARFLARDMYQARSLTCLSFHAAKALPLGRGGAILTDDKDAYEWLRAARMDGRPPGEPIEKTQFPGFHCPMPPDTAARGLWILSRWVDAGYDPPPLPHEEYADLSLL